MATDQDLQPLLDVRQNQLSFQLSVSDSLDTKALALLGSIVAILLFMIQTDLMLSWWGYAFSLVPYLLALVLCVAASWPHTYSGASVEPSDHPEYLEMARDDLVLQLLADTEAAIALNERLNSRRLFLFMAAIRAAGLATIVLLAILVV